MKKNMGLVDKVIRIIVAIVIGVLYLTHVISGTLATVLLVLAVVFVATAFLSFCPLYAPFGLKTCKTEEKE
ncbi:MAG: DUF2892 domain-containing protein [Bacteroidales bacterium]|nr:DUF2892 domain-containing protein [Bacteroidales bacterium]